MTAHLITGGAGFVAANLVRRLLAGNALIGHDSAGHAGGPEAGSRQAAAGATRVLLVDDLSRGTMENLAEFAADPRVTFVQADCADAAALEQIVRQVHQSQPIRHVWHMAANSDIPAGIADLRIDLQRTFLTTTAVLLTMKALGLPELHFASSSAIYGDLGEAAIGEDIGPLQPISNYGAMKLASEAQIRAAVEAFLPRANIFRFPNVVGVPATHGVILDLIRKLRATPDRLDVLGDGSQCKPYLHVGDLIDAMLFIAGHAEGRYNVFNIGPRDSGVTVRRIAEQVRDRVSPGAAIAYGEGGRGWVGDVPRFRYDVSRLEALGWTPRHGSDAAIARAVAEIAAQEGVPEAGLSQEGTG
jgi:UDP-glucose 4-epimerase